MDIRFVELVTSVSAIVGAGAGFKQGGAYDLRGSMLERLQREAIVALFLRDAPSESIQGMTFFSTL